MPKLTLVATNVCGSPSPFTLLAFVPKTAAEALPEVVVDLNPDLELVLQVNAAGDIYPGETVTLELEVEGLDLRAAQWAAPSSLRGRFRLDALTWGDHQLLRRPGVV